MKKLIGLCLLGCLLVISAAEAKKLDSQEYMPMYERLGNKQTDKIMRRIDPVGNGIVSVEQFKDQKLTRSERREIRREKKEGTYKTPEEEFKLIDKNEDGMASYDEMRAYYIKKAEQRYGS